MNRRLLFLPFVVLVLSLGTLSTFGDDSSFTWFGGGNPGDLGDGRNWDESSVPGGTLGTESVTFSTADDSQTILIPSSGFKLRNLIFENEGTGYTFHSNSPTPALKITHNITANSGAGNILFDNSIQLALSDACHIICVGDGVTVTIDSQIVNSSGSASILKKGSGTLVLDGNNTFSGGLTVDSGELVLGSSSDNSLTYSPVGLGTLTLKGGSYLTPGIANVTLGNTIVLTATGDNLVHIDEDDSTNNLTLTGMISGTGGLDWCTEGTLTLTNGGNTFTGNGDVSVDLRAGTLLIGASSTAHNDVELGRVIDHGPVGRGTLALYDDTTLGVVSSSGPQKLHNPIYLASDGTVTFDTSGGDLTLLGDITGDSEINKTGSGILTLGGTGNFFGGITVQAGTLDLASSSISSLGISGPVGRSSLKMLDGTTLGIAPLTGATTLHNDIELDCRINTNVNFDTTNGDLTLKGVISGSSSLTKIGSGYLTLSGNDSYSGGTIINQGFLVLGEYYDGEVTHRGSITGDVQFTGNTGLGGGELQFNRSNSYNFAGNISGPGRVSDFGSGIITLSGSNTYSGGTFVHNGTLADAGTGNFSPNSAVYVNSGAAVQANYSETVGGLDDYSGLYGTVAVASGATLTISTNSSDSFTGVISGAGGLVKTGSGTQTLSGSNTYGGGTTISQGTLVYGAAGAFGTGGVTINGGGISVGSGLTLSNTLTISGSAIVLGGNGTIGSAITADSHVVISPGNSPGNLTFSAGLTLASGGAISFQVYDANGPAGTGYDLITVSGGTLALTASANTITFNLVSIDGGNNTANAINFNPASNYSWMFATSPNSLITGFNPNQFNLVNGFTNNLAGGTFSFSESGDQHSLLLNFTPAAVPEPSTWALLVAGLGAVTVISRRRRRD